MINSQDFDFCFVSFCIPAVMKLLHLSFVAEQSALVHWMSVKCPDPMMVLPLGLRFDNAASPASCELGQKFLSESKQYARLSQEQLEDVTSHLCETTARLWVTVVIGHHWYKTSCATIISLMKHRLYKISRLHFCTGLSHWNRWSCPYVAARCEASGHSWTVWVTTDTSVAYFNGIEERRIFITNAWDAASALLRAES